MVCLGNICINTPHKGAKDDDDDDDDDNKYKVTMLWNQQCTGHYKLCQRTSNMDISRHRSFRI
jgi:hypothetical protein